MKKIPEKLFFCSYGFYLLVNILNASFYSKFIGPYLKIAMIICVLILIYAEILNGKIKKREMILLLSCMILFGILFFHLNGIAMFPLLFYIYSARNIEFRKITKFTMIESSILLLFVIVSAKLGIITNYKVVQVLFGVTRTRTYLGFRYALFPQMILFNITLCYMYSYKDELVFFKCLILILLNYLMFKFTDSRLSCYMSIFLIIILYLVSKGYLNLKNKKFLCYILILAFPLCSILSIAITISYNPSNKTMVELNEVLGGRLRLGKNSLNEYSVKLFGNDTKYIGAGLDANGKRLVGVYNYVDCMYINILEKYGIVFNVILFAYLTFIMYSIWKNEDYVLFIVLVGIAFHGIIDDLAIYLYYNVFWLIIGSYYYSLKKNKYSI